MDANVLIDYLGATWTLLSTALAVLFGYWMMYRWRHRRYYTLMTKFPCAPGIPIVGNFFYFFSKDHGKCIRQLRGDKYAELSRVQLGPIDLIYISHPKHLQAIFKSNVLWNRPKFAQALLEIFDGSILLLNHEQWKPRRQLLQQSFTPKMLQLYMSEFQRSAEALVEVFIEKNLDDGRQFDIAPYLTRATFEVIHNTIKETKLQVQKDISYNHFVDTLLECFHLLTIKYYTWWAYISCIYWFSSLRRKYLQKIAAIDEYIKSKVIAEKKKQFKEAADVSRNVKSKRFLDVMLPVALDSERPDFTEYNLMKEIVLLFVAGSDTTAMTLSGTVMMMARHPDIQKRVYDEQMEIFGDSYPEITKEQTNKMTYLNMVIKETQRLLTVIGVTHRSTAEDVLLDNGLIIPKDTIVSINLDSLHMNPEIWPEPSKFDPDRFLPENEAKRPAFSFAPFNGGPRHCIGYKYAEYEMKVFLSILSRKFKFSTTVKANEPKLIFSGVLRLDSYDISITARKSD